MIRRVIRLVAPIVVLAALAPQASAQYSSIPAYRTLVGLNPLGIPFDIASIEFETLVDRGFTFGASGSYVAVDDDDRGDAGERFTSLDLKARYYPGEVVLRGFAVGLSLGITRYSERVFDTDVCIPNPSACANGAPSSRESLVTPTLGILVDYNWMLGAERRFVVGTGLGAKRLLKRDSDIPALDPPRAYPFARFSIGIAF